MASLCGGVNQVLRTLKPPLYFGLLAGLIMVYLLPVEAGKRWFYKRLASA